MRIMAIDYGRKRVGIAISDPLCVIPQPLLTIRVRSQKKLLEELKSFVEENSVGLIIIGNPLTHSGKSSEMSEEIQEFSKKLRKITSIEVKLWDERFTSKYASRILKDAGLKGKKDKLDQIAATIILDEYLKSRSAYTA